MRTYKIKIRVIKKQDSVEKSAVRKAMPAFQKCVVFALIIGMNWSGLLVIGQTMAYYNDIETSSANAHVAGSLDFSLGAPDDFAPEVTPDADALRTADVSNDGSLGFQYTASTTNAVGTLCSSLNLVAKLDGTEKYNGPLSGFDVGPFVFDDPEDWDFTTSLNSDDPNLQNTDCNFDFQFDGWQENLAQGAGGFTDEEIISNTVTAGEWEVDSCTEEPVEITTVETGSSFDYSATNPNSNVVVKSGGELKSPTDGGTNGELTIDTDCDLTVESGGKITAVKGNGTGGTMTINARNFTVDDGGAVSAGSTVSNQNGGSIDLTTVNDITINGNVSANGHDRGGSVIATAGGDVSVNGSSLTATGANKVGGDILLTATGDIDVPGLISTSGKDSGGTIILLADGSLAVPAGGSILAESTNKNGGSIEVVVDGAGDISGTLSVNGKDGNGLVVMTIQDDLTVSGTGLITANSTSGSKDGGTIGIKVGGDATYSGTVRANATKNAKDVALWSEGSTTIGGTINALGGSGGGDTGGVIDITTRATLSGSGTLDASGPVNGSIIQWTVTNGFTGVSTPAATTQSITLNDIVLNEIIPDPAGSDIGSVAMPLDGEWVELYNKSGVAVDVNGWFLRDADSNILTISASKGDNDGDLSDAGETIVPAGGTLTVYRNGASGLTLNDDGDTVQLLTDTSVLVDSFTYVVDVGTGNSIARMPDGIGAWVDPEPTPTALNGGINIEKLRAEFLKRLSEALETEETGVDSVDEIVAGANDNSLVEAEIAAEVGTETLSCVLPVEESADEDVSTGGEAVILIPAEPAICELDVSGESEADDTPENIVSEADELTDGGEGENAELPPATIPEDDVKETEIAPEDVGDKPPQNDDSATETAPTETPLDEPTEETNI
ncbi:MAG: hypothetical protein A3C07_02615 [Candidatus Sungbacteria bacterium RIFCSPHIGHO2_02_FULL_47_11]|uniref:LTD domain-containing protein n=1 Tax=Candidatus Sungbacteria bacterium RIFCSPHIGHO2_02_FULL_47_11 TaxID=1802270 RepID=A0A1G2KJB0_9BACT|nr:MAG: hypothetical protein A3C07_02615 [Candidatus Sungbacteria bacterium RIFCSPHIGHO2_02_FULL_47_11]